MTEVIKVKDCGEKIGDYDIPIHNAIIIPNNATNGDVIKAMFPNELLTSITSTLWWGDNMSFNKDWWTAPYKTEDELSAVCVRSTEKEFEHLEWLLKNYYKKEPCEDYISRAEAQTEIEMNASRYTIAKECGGMGQVEWSDQLIKVSDAVDIIRHLPSVTPQPKTGHWMKSNIGGAKVCSVCNAHMGLSSFKFCPNCGTKMVEPLQRELENPFGDKRFGG